ncbi:MAG: hypothetical protein IPH64_12020 [Comamonadaceae bacterium]|nr:hypothetical protein [Comamonadaceae bacterium]
MNGGNGSDTYLVSGNQAGGWSSFAGFDTYADTGAAGTDRIVATGVDVDIGLRSFSATSGIEVIDASGATGTVRLLGDWSADTIDLRGVTVLGNVVVDGYHGNDSLFGNDADNTLRGGGGDDTLNGGNGSDTTSYPATRPVAGAASPASTPTPTPAHPAPTASWPGRRRGHRAAQLQRGQRHRGDRCLGRLRHDPPGGRLE